MAKHIIHRSIITLTLIVAFLTNATISPAQTVDDRQAKIAAAFQIFKEAVEIGNRDDVASKLVAIEKFKAAEKIFEEQKSEDNYAAALTIHGSLLITMGEIDSAYALVERSVEIFRRLKDEGGQTMGLMTIGAIHINRNEFEKARVALEEAWTHNEKSPLPGIDRELLRLLGKTYVALRDHKKAIDSYWKIFELTKEKGGDDAIVALKDYANAWIQLDMPGRAPFWLERALQMARDAKLKIREAEILDQLGLLYIHHLNEPEKAKAYLLDSLKAAEPFDLPLLKAEVLNGLGQCSMRMMEPAKALDYYNQALTFIPKFPKSEARHASLLYDIAQIQILLDEKPKARASLEQALTLAKAGNELMMQSSILQSLSGLAIADGDMKRALELSTEAGLILSRSSYPTKQAVHFLIEFGLLFTKAGLNKQASDTFASALTMSRRLGDKFAEATTIEATGIFHYNNGNYQKAIELYNEALVVFRALGLKPREARTLENLMLAWSKAGNSHLAVFFGKSAVNLFQGFRKSAIGFTSDQQRALSENFASAYRRLSEVLIAQGRIAEAEQVLTMLKQEELLGYVRRDDAVSKRLLETLTLSDEERAAITRYGAVAEQITALGKEFGELETERHGFAVGAFPKQKRYDELKQQIADASTAFEKFLEDLKLKFGQKNIGVAQVDSSLKKTLERLKAKRTAAVSTIVGNDTLSIIVTTSRTQRAHTVKISADEINTLVGDLRKSLTSSQYDPRPASQKLYDLIVKPIEGDLAGIEATTIVWSLDGTLRYLPPAVLWDKQKGYLVERFSNVIVNLANRTSLEKEPINTQQLTVLGVGVSKPAEGFGPLAAVPDELDCIVSDKTTGSLSENPQCSTGVLNGRKLLDEKFTFANFTGELGRYPIVHIASHFKLVPGDDKNSFLLLGGGADRRFSVEKLRNESFGDLELMVLSACNTATPAGSKTNGIEVESFGALAQEEARTVLATLWAVADPSTKEFMVEFYRLYGKEGHSKAEAMRKAQLKLMYGKYSANDALRVRADEFVTATDMTLQPFKPDPNAPFAHPYYWSPFTLIGNWR